MMRMIDEILASVTTEEKLFLLEKFEETANMFAEGLAVNGYRDSEKNESEENNTYSCENSDLADCEEGMYDGNLDKELIEEEAADFGMDLALSVLEMYWDDPVKLIEIQNFLNMVYEERSKKSFLTAIETVAQLVDSPDSYMGYMWICRKNKKTRNIFLAEFLRNFDAMIDYRLNSF